MNIRSAVMQIANQDPRFKTAVDAIEKRLEDMPIDAKDLDEAIKFLEFVLQHPDSYEQALQAAVKDKIIDEGFLPPQYDQTVIVSFLIALYGLQDRLKKGMARGGLAQAAQRLQAAGRNGDTMLAHINPSEAAMLKSMGGSGTINPRTGLPEYGFFSSLGKIFKMAAPIVMSVIAPGIGTSIGTMLGMSGVGATIAGSAILGGATAALTGDDVLKGAGMGALSGGIGGMIGGGVGDALGINMSPMVQGIVGNALAGGAMGAVTGQGFFPGLATGALGGGISGLAGQMLPSGGMQTAGQTFGNALTAGYSPGQAAAGAAMSGLASSLLRPSDQAIQQTRASQNWMTSSRPAGMIGPDLQSPDVFDLTTGYTGGLQQTATGDLINPSLVSGAAQGMSQMAAPASSGMLSGMSPWGKAALIGGGLMMANELGKSNLTNAQPQVKQEVSKLSPSQQEYFNRPMRAWDWDKLQADANRANMSLGDYMARNWNKVFGGQYNAGVAAAEGGALSNIARFAQGAGSGRDDTIDAKLSDGEYVIDAETVALLGDGSGKRGAQLLDRMREQIRKQKGKALAKGKISPNAKSPLAYIKGVA